MCCCCFTTWFGMFGKECKSKWCKGKFFFISNHGKASIYLIITDYTSWFHVWKKSKTLMNKRSIAWSNGVGLMHLSCQGRRGGGSLTLGFWCVCVSQQIEVKLLYYICGEWSLLSLERLITYQIILNHLQKFPCVFGGHLHMYEYCS